VRKFIYTLLGVAVAFLTLTLARPAMANEFPAWDMKTVTAPGPSFETCPNLKGFYDNEDEQDRLPVVTEAGLKFSGKQLIHHAVSMDLKDVKPGSYEVSTAPKNNGAAVFDDFFSIEVANTSAPVHYGTLRYELTGPHAGTWNIGGTSLYSPVNPTGAELEQFATDNNRSTNVISYGVGYPNSPSDGVETVVSSISFHGVKHDLTCKPKPTETATSKPTTTVKPKPSASKSSSHAAAPVAGSGGTSGGALAITGSSTRPIVVGGAAVLVVGAVLFMLTRKRRAKFVA
jgi:hypothetical protein